MSLQNEIDKQINEMNKELTLYHKDVLDEVEAVTREIGAEARTYIRDIGGYTDQTRDYRLNFVLDVVRDSLRTTAVLRNRRWQLTHLLEDGHLTRNGTTRTRAFPHWGPTEEMIIDKYYNTVSKRVGDL